MSLRTSRRRIGSVAFILILMFNLLAAGCSGQQGPKPGDGLAFAAWPVRIGTMATEDMLPYWVAEQEGLFEAAGLDVEIITFQSAQELSTAFVAGELEMAMTDPMVTISMAAGGLDIELLWVTLGQTAEQGRFGVLAHPDSGIESLADLAGVPVAIGSNTIPEYTFDRLMAAAGIAPELVVYEEVMRVPVRYEMLVNHQVEAAALPASLLYLGEQSGMVLVADDSSGENISQTLMIARASFVDALAADPASAVMAGCLREVWDEAVALVNADPAAWRALLAERAQLPAPIAADYPVPTYPQAALPADWMVGNVLDWMAAKGYLTAPVSYDPASGRLSRD